MAKIFDATQTHTALEEIYNGLVKTKDQTKPFVLYEDIRQQAPPDFSIVMPIHNQVSIIEQTLTSVLTMTHSPYELIIILDGCRDKTEMIVTRMCQQQQQHPLLLHVVIIKQESPIFETACDNIGFQLSLAPYIIEVQADMLILEPGYEQILAYPAKTYSNVIGVSGRGCTWFNYRGGYGKLGPLIEYTFEQITNNADGGRHYTIDRKLNKKIFYVMETCMRGPLLLCRQKLTEMNFLDEKNFYLDNSDHDLFARAYYQKGYICGYAPIEVISKLVDGSTRKPRDQENQEAMDERRQRSDGGFYSQLSKVYRQKNPELLEVGEP